MMYTISLTIVAMSFGGIIEQTGMLRSVVGANFKSRQNRKKA
ncbi:Na+/H+ antiporter NhaC family protein [Moraxella caviae]|nr:Na+/H+ antiporter NhaC family protein [Moraxella caviae]